MTFSGILYSSVIILHSPSLSLNANWSLSKQPVKGKIGLLKKFIRNWSTLFNSHGSQKTSKTCTDMTRSQRGRIHARGHPLFDESPLERRVRVARREKSYIVYAVNYVNVWTDWFSLQVVWQIEVYFYVLWHLCPITGAARYWEIFYSNVNLTVCSRLSHEVVCQSFTCGP